LGRHSPSGAALRHFRFGFVGLPKKKKKRVQESREKVTRKDDKQKERKYIHKNPLLWEIYAFDVNIITVANIFILVEARLRHTSGSLDCGN
jgi:hypothetical protein